MKLVKMVKRFVKDERGLEGSEYALLLALICLAIIVAIVALRDEIARAFQTAANEIGNATDTAG
jgi:Flp pilus assembly pilin Flp